MRAISSAIDGQPINAVRSWPIFSCLLIHSVVGCCKLCRSGGKFDSFSDVLHCGESFTAFPFPFHFCYCLCLELSNQNPVIVIDVVIV